MKKFLFISAIILNFIGIFSLYSTALISQASAQQGNCKALGSECNNDDKKCCSQLDRDYGGYKKGDPLACGKKIEDPANADGKPPPDTCVVNKALKEGNFCLGDAAHTSIEGGVDVSNGQTQAEEITLKAYEKCEGDLVCNTTTAKCEKNTKLICPKTNQNTNVQCKWDSSSTKEHQKQDPDKICCGGYKCCQKESDGEQCKGNVGKCITDVKKSNQCLTDKNTGEGNGKVECKGDYTSRDYKDGTLEEGEVCCGEFQCWESSGKPDKQGPKICWNRRNNKVCAKEGQDAKGDQTTKDVLAPSERCCAGLKHKDGKCIKELACLDEGSECTKGNWKCCGEQSCIISPGANEGKCREGLPFPPSPPCAKGKFQNGKCTAVTTAFGDLNTDPEDFIRSIFGVMLAMSGGIALLLIMKSGYLIMTAQGKPEALQQARDQLIAAIVGLLFLIFSFVLLQVIGFEILKIPEIKIGQQ